MVRRALALLLAFAVCASATRASAEVLCAPIEGGSAALGAIDSGRRLDFIQRRLNADARRVRIWAWSWASIYTGLVVVNGTRLALSRSREDKIDNGTATGASMLGLAVLAIMPPAVLRDQARLARIVARSGERDSDRCALVAAAERILLRDAASEAFSAGPLPHAGNFVFNMGLGLLLAVGFGRLDTGMIVALTGMTVGEIQMLSVRTRVRETLARYRSGALDTANANAAPSIGWTVVPILNREQYGVQFGLTF